MGKKGHCRESKKKKKKKKKKKCAMSKFGILLSLALLGFFLSQGDAKTLLVETEGEGAGDLPEVENRQLDGTGVLYMNRQLGPSEPTMNRQADGTGVLYGGPWGKKK